jgi:hypothetical protein
MLVSSLYFILGIVVGSIFSGFWNEWKRKQRKKLVNDFIERCQIDGVKGIMFDFGKDKKDEN